MISSAAPEDDAYHRPAAAARRKGTASRAWLVVAVEGGSCLEEVGKHSVMLRTGLPARDLRVLDPLLSYPSTILGRERAIVINLEHIRAIITATEVLIPNSKDPQVASFVQDLLARVSVPYGGPARQVSESNDMDGEARHKATASFPSDKGEVRHQTSTINLTVEMPGSRPRTPLDSCRNCVAKDLSFEFRALEACLESACKCLEFETLALEQEAYPALDELTSKISTLNLKRVRHIKSRLVAISGRVQKVRDELEHLLDDDMDMAEMYLTEKLICQPVDETLSRVNLDNGALEEDGDNETEIQQKKGDDDSQDDAKSSHSSLGGFKPNIQDLEMLLEAYFVQIDGTLHKLSTLREYVDDTEDYINIMLDDKQNQLLQMGVMLSTGTVLLTAGVVVVSLFGMNIDNSLFNAPYHTFWETTFGTIGGCVILYIMGIAWGKKSGLLQ